MTQLTWVQTTASNEFDVIHIAFYIVTLIPSKAHHNPQLVQPGMDRGSHLREGRNDQDSVISKQSGAHLTNMD